MKIVTINIADQYLEAIEILVNLGFYPSRSEAVRQALKQFLTNEADLIEELNLDIFEKRKKHQMDILLGGKWA